MSVKDTLVAYFQKGVTLGQDGLDFAAKQTIVQKANGFVNGTIVEWFKSTKVGQKVGETNVDTIAQIAGPAISLLVVFKALNMVGLTPNNALFRFTFRAVVAVPTALVAAAVCGTSLPVVSAVALGTLVLATVVSPRGNVAPAPRP